MAKKITLAHVKSFVKKHRAELQMPAAPKGWDKVDGGPEGTSLEAPLPAAPKGWDKVDGGPEGTSLEAPLPAAPKGWDKVDGGPEGTSLEQAPAVQVAIVDAEKAGLINGPFWVVVVKDRAVVSSCSGIARKADFARVWGIQ